jgi:DNA-binding NtrC family response regulator
LARIEKARGIFVRVHENGAAFATATNNSREANSQERDGPLHHTMILILSADAVAAALLGALIETLGYSIRFARAAESPSDAIRRVRPKVCLLDCGDPDSCSEEVSGRATMRGVSVVIFGTREALEQFRTFVTEHDIDMLIVPPDPEILDETLRRALLKAG